MILEKQESIVRKTIGNVEGFDMEISTNDMRWIMGLLSDLYKDPYSIIPQEYVSNAYDATIEAKSKNPVIVKLTKDINNDWFFGVTDYGVGISPERIKIFGSYGKSTKRETNDELGGLTEDIYVVPAIKNSTKTTLNRVNSGKTQRWTILS